MSSTNKELTAENMLVIIEEEGVIVCADDRCACEGQGFPLGKVPTETEDVGGGVDVFWSGISAEWLAGLTRKHLGEES